MRQARNFHIRSAIVVGVQINAISRNCLANSHINAFARITFNLHQLMAAR
jgi:hypothetical protein